MTYLYRKFETTEIIGLSLSSAYLWSGKEMITIHSYKYSKQIEELQPSGSGQSSPGKGGRLSIRQPFIGLAVRVQDILPWFIFAEPVGSIVIQDSD